MQDFDFAASLMPGKKKLNLHASYAIFENGDFADRDKIEPRHFEKWVKFAKDAAWESISIPHSSRTRW